MTTVPGIDWPKVRATGQRFVFVRATEGESYSDPTFENNWVGAKTSGLLRGAYCFFHPNQKWVTDVTYVSTQMENLFGYLKEGSLRQVHNLTFKEANQTIDDYIYFDKYERIQLKTRQTPSETRCLSS